jgi:hypothetical protein
MRYIDDKKAYLKQYYIDNKERIAKQREGTKKHLKKLAKIRYKKWRKDNPIKGNKYTKEELKLRIKVQQEAYRIRNRDKLLANQRAKAEERKIKWRETHPKKPRVLLTTQEKLERTRLRKRVYYWKLRGIDYHTKLPLNTKKQP